MGALSWVLFLWVIAPTVMGAWKVVQYFLAVVGVALIAAVSDWFTPEFVTSLPIAWAMKWASILAALIGIPQAIHLLFDENARWALERDLDLPLDRPWLLTTAAGILRLMASITVGGITGAMAAGMNGASQRLQTIENVPAREFLPGIKLGIAYGVLWMVIFTIVDRFGFMSRKEKARR